MDGPAPAPLGLCGSSPPHSGQNLAPETVIFSPHFGQNFMMPLDSTLQQEVDAPQGGPAPAPPTQNGSPLWGLRIRPGRTRPLFLVRSMVWGISPPSVVWMNPADLLRAGVMVTGNGPQLSDFGGYPPLGPRAPGASKSTLPTSPSASSLMATTRMGRPSAPGSTRYRWWARYRPASPSQLLTRVSL